MSGAARLQQYLNSTSKMLMAQDRYPILWSLHKSTSTWMHKSSPLPCPSKNKFKISITRKLEIPDTRSTTVLLWKPLKSSVIIALWVSLWKRTTSHFIFQSYMWSCVYISISSHRPSKWPTHQTATVGPGSRNYNLDFDNDHRNNTLSELPHLPTSELWSCRGWNLPPSLFVLSPSKGVAYTIDLSLSLSLSLVLRYTILYSSLYTYIYMHIVYMIINTVSYRIPVLYLIICQNISAWSPTKSPNQPGFFFTFPAFSKAPLGRIGPFKHRRGSTPGTEDKSASDVSKRMAPPWLHRLWRKSSNHGCHVNLLRVWIICDPSCLVGLY